MLLKLFLLGLGIVFSRAAYYFYYLKRVQRYSDIYATYANKQDSKSSQALADVKIQIKHVFKLTGIDKYKVPYVQPVGMGYVSSGNISPVDNIHNLREDIVGAIIGLFEQAIGTCKSRCINSFNPIFWLESLIYFPTKFFSYLGINNKFLVKLFQSIWWLFGAVAMVIGVVFNEQFVTWLKSIL